MEAATGQLAKGMLVLRDLAYTLADAQLARGRTKERVLKGTAKRLRILQDQTDGHLKNSPFEPSSIACRAGCNHCCHQATLMTFAEIVLMSEWISGQDAKTLDALKARVAAYVEGYAPFWERKQVTGYRALCPMNIDGSCIAYEHRPTNCRTFYSRDVEACKAHYIQGQEIDIPGFFGPQHTGAALSRGEQLALADHDLPGGMYDLSMTLKILLDDPGLIDRIMETGDGSALLGADRSDPAEIAQDRKYHPLPVPAPKFS